MDPAVSDGVSGNLRVDDKVLQADALPAAEADTSRVEVVAIVVWIFESTITNKNTRKQKLVRDVERYRTF